MTAAAAAATAAAVGNRNGKLPNLTCDQKIILLIREPTRTNVNILTWPDSPVAVFRM